MKDRKGNEETRSPIELETMEKSREMIEGEPRMRTLQAT